jgi:hypothetical protein
MEIFMRFNTETNNNTSTTSTINHKEVLKELEDTFSLFDIAKAEIKRKFQENFQTIYIKIFQAVPQIKAIGWSQYTPYFMDGDACEFSVNEINFLSYIPESLSGYYEDDIPTEQDFLFSCYHTNANPLNKDEIAILSRFSKFIDDNEEFMKQLFDDHTLVLLTIDGYQTEEYEHD